MQFKTTEQGQLLYIGTCAVRRTTDPEERLSKVNAYRDRVSLVKWQRNGWQL